MTQLYTGPGAPLTQQGITDATALLGVGEPELWAVFTVETRGFGFQADRFPAILFERHIFHRLTKGAFDQQAPDLSDPSAGGWGASADQKARLQRAMALDQDAAMKSASWGLGQVMGENYAVAGYASVQDFAAAMMANEDNQLMASARFIKKNPQLCAALRDRDWAGFAYRYNGPTYANNQYDTKLAQAFQQLSAGHLPDLEIRRAQALLTYLGYRPGPVDGLWGNATRVAENRFQKDNGHPVTVGMDDVTRAAIEAAAIAKF